eukprot:gene18056-biopygen12413
MGRKPVATAALHTCCSHWFSIHLRHHWFPKGMRNRSKTCGYSSRCGEVWGTPMKYVGEPLHTGNPRMYQKPLPTAGVERSAALCPGKLRGALEAAPGRRAESKGRALKAAAASKAQESSLGICPGAKKACWIKLWTSKLAPQLPDLRAGQFRRPDLPSLASGRSWLAVLMIPTMIPHPMVVQDDIQQLHIIARRSRRILVISMPIHTNVINYDYDTTECIVLRCRPRSFGPVSALPSAPTWPDRGLRTG